MTSKVDGTSEERSASATGARLRWLALGFAGVVFLTTAAEAGAQDCSTATVQAVGLPRPISGPYPPSEQEATLSVAAPPACSWTIGWDPLLFVDGPAARSGSADVRVILQANPGGERSPKVTITFAGQLPQDFYVPQRGCLRIFSPAPYDQIFPGDERRLFIDAAGGRRVLSVHPGSVVCQWLGTSDAAWIKMGAGGIGNVGGFVPYDVDPNYTGAERTGTIHVGHLTITVRQAARVAGDVNGDGYPDLFWHHRTTGQIAAWLMRGLSLLDGRLLDPPQVPDTAWSVAGVGDYARTDETDAAPDIVWEHDDGRVALWQMNGTAMTSGDPVGASQPDPEWRVRALADLNGDGRQDLIWRHRETGALRGWLMMGRTHLTDATIGPGAVADLDWDIVGSGDFDGDGQVDLVWQNSTTGAISTWLLEAQSVWPGQAIWRVKSGVLFSPGRVADTAWKIRGVADMDRDGKPDLIWQHETSGLIATWLMDGLTLRDGTLFTSGQVQDTDWTIVGPK